MAFVPKLPFPNVPNLPGVPALPRSPNFPTGVPPVLELGVAAFRLYEALTAAPVWGIFKEDAKTPTITEDADGVQTVDVTPSQLVQVVKPDSIIEFSYKNEWDVADAPIQLGGFANYNKVNNPFEISVRMTKAGSAQARADFIAEIEAIAGTLDLYQIITPEKTYHNCNVTRYEVSRRGAGGAYFLSEVDLYFREIRTVSAEYTNTASATQNAQDPSAEPVTNVGTQSPGTTETDVPAGVVSE